LLIALVITSRRVIARASRQTRRSMFCIQRPYRSQRTCLNVYAPDISNVYDTRRSGACCFSGRFAIILPMALRRARRQIIDKGTGRSSKVTEGVPSMEARH
jgi:hypothetical protein